MVVEIAFVALFVACAAFVRACVDHVSQERRLEFLRGEVERARKMIAHRAELANEVAHEIKNPLTAILCSAETLNLVLGDKLDKDHKQSLKYIKEYGDILLRLVSDFLDLNRAEAGHMTPQAEPTAVVPAVRSIVGLLKYPAMQKNITVKLLHNDENAQGLIDPRHLKQVLFNLIHNAVNYTGDGGEIQVVVGADPLAGCLLVSVKDNGRGIPADKLEKIFEIYERYETNSEHAEFKLGIGTGLGLALCKSLIEMAGGQIRAASTPGVGSSFDFVIPLATAKQEKLLEAEPTQEAKSTTQPLLGLNFLIVDEDLGSRESVAKLIQAWGGAVDNVREAVEALHALEQKSYDAVMIDGELASADGYGMAKAIKDSASNKNATLIVAGKDSHNREQALAAGADAFIEKPFNGKLLLESIINSHNQH